MRSPAIEPDLSTRKMYSPLYSSKVTLVDRGVQKVSPTHCLPTVQTGVVKSACSKVNSRSFSGTLSSIREQLREQSLKTCSSSKCEDEPAPRIFLVLLRLMRKSHSVLASAKPSTVSGEESSSFLKRVLMYSSQVWYLGPMCEGILSVHLFCSSLVSFPTMSNSILTLSAGCRFPSLTLSTAVSFSEVVAIMTVFPCSLAALYSAFTFSLSWMTPSTVTLSQTATTRAMQKLGSVGIEQWISRLRWKGFLQTWTDLTSAKLFLRLTSYRFLTAGTKNFSPFSRKLKQWKLGNFFCPEQANILIIRMQDRPRYLYKTSGRI